jgi:hypothetical protein
LRIVQVRTEETSQNCTNYKTLATNNCLKQIKTSTYIKDEYEWDYQPNTDGKKVIGTLMDYDNSGFVIDLNLFNEKSFYETLDDLINSNWVDSNTVAIITLINFYNINHDLLLNVRSVHERIEENFFPIVDYNLVDMDPNFDSYLIAAIILSIFTLISMLNEWKKHNPDPVKKADIEASGFKALMRFYKRNFRSPNLFEIISKYYLNIALLNFLFFYVVVIMRFSYYYSLSVVTFDLTKYNDMDEYTNKFELITTLHCAVIFIFMFNVLNHVSYISPEFKIIAKSLSKVTIINCSISDR